MSNSISTNIVEYGQKLDLLRVYLSYYTDADLGNIFRTNSIIGILENYTYSEIKARLVNSKNNALEDNVVIGHIVTILKPYLKNGVYTNLQGVIIGYRTVYSDLNRLEYYKMYDILVRVSDISGNYQYDVRHETINDILVSDNVVSDFENVLNEYLRYTIDMPV